MSNRIEVIGKALVQPKVISAAREVVSVVAAFNSTKVYKHKDTVQKALNATQSVLAVLGYFTSKTK